MHGYLIFLSAHVLCITVTERVVLFCFVAVFCVHEWTTEEVGQWLETIGLSEYRDVFIRNDIRGPELLNLERRDLKVR